MFTLRPANPPSARHEGEVFGCTYSPDSSVVLSAGWDSHLRAWDASSGELLAAVRVGNKPLAACAMSPDGKHWLAGSMEGVVSVWDAATQELLEQSVVHTRPVSAICFAADGERRATSSWDRGLNVTVPRRDRDSKALHGHEDIVAGCCFVPGGPWLLSWSHDRTVRRWNAETGWVGPVLKGHADRVTAGAASPDGRWAATGSRNGQLIVWDLETNAESDTIKHPAELRFCAFLLDGESLLTVDSEGNVNVLMVPGLEHVAKLSLGQRVVCGCVSPRGNQLALGCEDGSVRLVDLEGCDARPRIVIATQTSRRISSGLKWLFGRTTVKKIYETTCPSCRKSVQIERLPADPIPCPHCRSSLRFSKNVLMTQLPWC